MLWAVPTAITFHRLSGLSGMLERGHAEDMLWSCSINDTARKQKNINKICIPMESEPPRDSAKMRVAPLIISQRKPDSCACAHVRVVINLMLIQFILPSFLVLLPWSLKCLCLALNPSNVPFMHFPVRFALDGSTLI